MTAAGALPVRSVMLRSDKVDSASGAADGYHPGWDLTAVDSTSNFERPSEWNFSAVTLRDSQLLSAFCYL